MNFRIATWNMDHWKKTKLSEKSWQYLFGLEVDVALVQEAKAPPHGFFNVWRQISSKGRRWGSGVVSQGLELTEITKAGKSKDLLRTWPGSVAIAQVNPPKSSPITLISCYGLIDEGYAQTTMLRIIADLIPLFDSRLGKRVIFAGDLNITTQLEGETVRKRHKAILEAIKSLGLIDCLELKRELRHPPKDCPCAENPNCGHVITHQHEKTGGKYQNDYIFVTETLRDKLTDCYVMDDQKGFPKIDGKWELSDHCPVIAEFVL